jgi:[amino-group carrier protein]-gamma-(L-lysyl/L-ornithyl)-L-glutamate aminotransferase
MDAGLMELSMSEIMKIEAQHTSGVYTKRKLIISYGKGALLYDDQGNEYIDCVGGQGAANLGHGHPKISEALNTQSEKLISCPEMFYNQQRSDFLAQLCSVAPEGLKYAFFGNSGTEAVEAALKFARYATGKREVIAAMRGFHGRSMGALSATWNKHYRKPFEPLVPDFHHVPYNKSEKLEAAISDKTAAVLLEVVQGEGGVHPGSREYLQQAQELCNKHGSMLIIDEVQTGYGRTGKLFACEHHDLQPDLLCIGKSIAGGVPMGATLFGDKVGRLSPGIHGSTFGGNPLSCAAGLAALQVQKEEKLPERAAVLGENLLKQLQEIESPLIREVRGLGLMIGIELKHKSAPYLKALTDHGVLALPAGLNVIRLLPPLVIAQEQLDKVVSTLEEVLT